MPTAKKESTEKAPEKKAPEAKAAPKKAASNGTKTELKDFLAEVSKRAYELYQKRQSEHRQGDEMSDWLEAEAEVKKKRKL